MALLTIALCTHMEYNHELSIFLHSCCMQNNKDFKLQVFHDGPYGDPHEPTSTSAFLSEKICNQFKDELDLEFRTTPIRYNDLSHTQRAESLKYIDTKYLNWQNGDNYLTPYFVQCFMEAMESRNLDFCYSDLLHNYGNPGRPYTVMDCRPELGHIDIANFCVKTEWAKRVGFNNRCPGADGMFVEDLFKFRNEFRYEKISVVPVVHN